jgi:hydroxymethylglutaryl-CoA lyase
VIRLVEVGPRDGLQNDPRTIPLDRKVAFIDALSEAGLPEIEAGAFVSPKWVPQLADSGEVFARIRRRPGTLYSALVPNLRGLERALAAKAGKIAVFTAASETFNRKNVNASVAESFERFAPVIAGAKAAKLPVRGYVSTAFWCPFEGRVDPVRAAEVCVRLADAGCDEISVGDTIGRATPQEVLRLLDLLLPRLGASRIALHCHDTFGKAVENLRAGRSAGVETFDASVGGLGGCPYAPGAPGNVATESVAEAFGVPLDRAALDRARRILAGYTPA